MIKTAVILCGGYGTRLYPLTKNKPKPMVKVNKKPFITYLINQCKENGINKIILLCGYKNKIIENYFKNTKHGIKLICHYDHPDVETYTRIFNARDLLDKNFLLLYSDNYSSLNLKDLTNRFIKTKSKFLISIVKKDTGNIDISNKSSKISSYSYKKKKNFRFVDIGYMIINKQELLKHYFKDNSSLSSLIYLLSKKKKIDYYINDTGYLSISDPNRLKKTEKFFQKQIILIDRDGVLNQKNKNHRYVRTVNELNINLKFIYKYKDKLKAKKIICITNQAGVATGDLKLQDLNKINKKIKFELKKHKIDICSFYISKDHFKSNSFFRKPNHGLFLKAAKDHEFILDRTLYIGDDLRDVEAAFRAKTKCLYIGVKNITKELKKRYEYTLLKKF